MNLHIKNKVSKNRVTFRVLIKKLTRLLLMTIASAFILCVEVLAEDTSISYLYHAHVGKAELEGGCYKQPIYHGHTGNESQGGLCYQDAIYHSHSGSEEVSNGCYLKPEYHVHKGDVNMGGECYQKIYHTHTSGCYQTTTCTITLAEFIYCFQTYYETCYHHGNTVHGKWTANLRHSSCGQGVISGNVSVCNTCKYYGSNQHDFTRTVCARENEVVGYGLKCSKNDTSIEKYLLSCNKEVGQSIEGYRLSCKRTKDSIDGYTINCGKEEKTVCGYVKIINTTQGTVEQVSLRASWEDYTGQLTQASSFIWKDSYGNQISSGNQIVVKENGNYTVSLQLKNDDIKKQSLSTTIKVSNIQGKTVDYKDENNGNQGLTNQNNGNLSLANPSNGNLGLATPTIPVETALPTKKATPVLPAVTPSISPTHQRKSDNEKATSAVQTKLPIFPTRIKEKPVEEDELQIETQSVELEEKNAAGKESISEQKVLKKKMPIAKVITLTLGGALLIMGFIGLTVLFWSGVRIYCDNGEGLDCFIGVALIGNEEDHFVLNISDTLVEQAYTNCYCLRINPIFARKHSQKELLVSVNDKKKALFIEGEIRFHAS